DEARAGENATARGRTAKGGHDELGGGARGNGTDDAEHERERRRAGGNQRAADHGGGTYEQPGCRVKRVISRELARSAGRGGAGPRQPCTTRCPCGLR